MPGNNGDFFRMLEQALEELMKRQLGEDFNDAVSPFEQKEPANDPAAVKPRVTRTAGNGRYFDV